MPFSTEQFFDVIARYNQALFPAQVIAFLLAVVAVWQVFKRSEGADRYTAGVLALLWVWMGVAYHFAFFTAINPAAWLFGSLFIVQGLLFGWALWKEKLSFGWPGGATGWAGGILLAYGLVLYNIWTLAGPHGYPQSPIFSLPCPTTIFTFGLLLWTTDRVPKVLLVIPFLWTLVGTSAAVNFQVIPDYGLGLAGVVGTLWVVLKDRKGPEPEMATLD